MHRLNSRTVYFTMVLILLPQLAAAGEPPADDPSGVDARRAADAFEIPAIRADFPVKAGMTIAQIDAFTEAQDSLANEPPDLEKDYNFGWHKRDIEDGSGWMYYWINGKRLLHCDIIIHAGKAQSVWVMPGNAEWAANIFFRLSGAGPHNVDTSNDPSKIESDKQLAEMERPLRLDRLWLSDGPDITDQGMRHLNRFANVEILSIGHTSISGTSLGYLQSLKKLRKLSLGSIKIEGDGLRQISSITSIKDLSLSRNKTITDDVLIHLSRLPLRSLDLSGTLVTSNGVKVLSQFRDLTELRLGECRSVDDRAVETLSLMKQLKGLDILFSGISQEGCNALREKLPKCHIVFFERREPPKSVD